MTQHPLLVLIGLPGSGKSAVAEAVAKRHSAPLRDTDTDIEQAHGQDVGSLIISQGEEAFRTIEADTAKDALTVPGAVVALGSGAITAVSDHLNLIAREGGTIAYLEVSASQAIRRLGLGAVGAPALGSPRALWTKMSHQRAAEYEAAATVTINTSERTLDQVIDAAALL